MWKLLLYCKMYLYFAIILHILWIYGSNGQVFEPEGNVISFRYCYNSCQSFENIPTRLSYLYVYYFILKRNVKVDLLEIPVVTKILNLFELSTKCLNLIISRYAYLICCSIHGFSDYAKCSNYIHIFFLSNSSTHI